MVDKLMRAHINVDYVRVPSLQRSVFLKGRDMLQRTGRVWGTRHVCIMSPAISERGLLV